MVVVMAVLGSTPSLANNTITVGKGTSISSPGTVQAVTSLDIAGVQGVGAIKVGTFAGLSFASPWGVYDDTSGPTNDNGVVDPLLLYSNGNKLTGWALMSSADGGLFNLSRLELVTRAGQADTRTGWLEYYQGGKLVGSGSTDSQVEGVNASLRFTLGAYDVTRVITPDIKTFYDEVRLVFDSNGLTPGSVGIRAFSVQSSSIDKPFGLSAGVTAPSVPAVTPAVPEPQTCALLLAGLGLLGMQAQRRKARP